MSQSPVDDLSAPATEKYLQGWRALSRLLHEDRSFSGKERHCAFLNLRGKKAAFADVSSITGFGFPEDGRGLATSDWDFDGDLDVWITNRTAPRLRFLKNNTSSPGRFVAFKLSGDGRQCNRDAIGARLELHLEGVEPHRRIRTLRGGEGFVSQSSNWIHFGLGEATGIARLIVRWPGGKAEEFTGVEPGRFYRVVQHSGKVVPFSPPAGRPPLTAARQQLLASSSNTRTIAPAGLPLPALHVLAQDGSPTQHQYTRSKPTILNIWSSTCAPCLVELSEWSTHEKELLSHAEVITLSTDHLSGSGTDEETLAALRKAGSKFPNRKIADKSLKSLDFLQRSVLDRWLPLPVPSTFLISPDGELIAFYKGPVSARQLLQDLELCRENLPTDARRNASIPFPGRWIGSAVPAQPNRVASLMADHNEVELGASYLQNCASILEPRATDEDSRRDLGDIYYIAGLLNGLTADRRPLAIKQLTRAGELIPRDVRVRLELGRQHVLSQKLHEAAAQWTIAAEINPSDLALLMDLGMLHFRLGEFEKSHGVYTKVVHATPRNGLVRYHLANNEVRLKRLPEAIENYRKALERIPSFTQAANNLAWILASHPDATLRSADEALRITTSLCKQTGEKNPLFLDTHSVALANAGRFEEAIQSANKALALLPPQSKPALAGLRSRIALYRERRAYREAAWQNSPSPSPRP